MGEDKKDIGDILEKLTLVTEASQEIFPNGKSIVLYELNDEDFKSVQKNFREIDSNRLRFKIEISGSEVVFINTKIYDVKEEEKEESKPKKNDIEFGFFKKLLFNIRSKFSINK